MNYRFTHFYALVCGAILCFNACSSVKSRTPVQAATSSDPYAQEEKIDSLIKLMTLEEKVGMIHASSSFTSGGVKRLSIPELTMSDGPHGVRVEHGRDWSPDADANDAATYLPTGVTLAATWNPTLGYQYGKVLGNEAKARGKDVILGPGVNIIRTPLNGRNFEYLSEDPYLNSRMAIGYIKGVQDQGIAACVKHFLANNQETERGTINVEMSERALREIYLPAFKAAVQEGGVYTLMGSYNKFRGQHCTHNDYLINKILKGEFGFQGLVMSDWAAVHNTMEALQNGTDLEMGTDLDQKPPRNYGKFYLGDTVVSLVKSGKVSELLVNDKVRRILRVMEKTNMLSGKRTPGDFNTPENQATALKVAEEGIVLLKNEGNVLPLKRESVRTIAIIGDNAVKKHSMGGGSSQVKAKYEITPLEGLQQLAGSAIKLTHVPGYKVAKNQQADPQLIAEAVKAASESETAIVIGGWSHGYSLAWNDNAFDAEGVDKPNLTMPFGQDELIEAVLKANPNTIIVLMGGGPIDVSKWEGRAKAIVQAWYPGMEGGKALARILFGEVNPSGKLPMTFPKKLEDSPAHKIGEYPGSGKNGVENYKEGIFVGYRYFDTYKVEPQFAFGHGLSYTQFKYSNLRITPGKKGATVRLSVQNTGSKAGAEVIQLYIKDEKAAVERPEKELKAFKKVFLEPGETQEVVLTLNEDAFQYYDETKRKWVLEAGKFSVIVGSSSKDIRLTGELTL